MKISQTLSEAPIKSVLYQGTTSVVPQIAENPQGFSPWGTFCRLNRRLLGAFAVVAVLAVGAAIAQTTTLKGIVSDQMCGAHHMMSGGAAKCTRECVGMGSPYALVVGNKVYTLKADAQAKKELYALAGASAVITGTVSGTTVQVASVAPGK